MLVKAPVMGGGEQVTDDLHATIDIPSWMSGDRPVERIKESRFRVIERVGETTWTVQTEESYRKLAPGLIELRTLWAAGATRSNWRGVDVTDPRSEDERAAMRGVKIAAPQTDAGEITALVVRMWQDPNARVPDNADAVAEYLRHGMAPDAALYLLRASGALMSRMKLAQVWTTLWAHPTFDVHAARRNLNQLQFRSSESLVNGLTLMDPYVGPLAGALSPEVWVLPVSFPSGGSLLYSLGRRVMGLPQLNTRLIDFVPTRSPDTFGKSRLQIDALAADTAITWWSERLSELFGVLSDPATFTDRDGVIRADSQFRANLTVEQLFRRVTSLTAHFNDLDAALALMFDACDLLPGLGVMSELFELTKVRKRLGWLERQITGPEQIILLNPARRGLRALEGVQNGFFLSGDDQYGQDERGAALDAERATAHYLKMRRDAVHGFTESNKAKEKLRRQLLARHTGELSSDLPLLIYVFLLDLLCRPETLRHHLRQQTRRTQR